MWPATSSSRKAVGSRSIRVTAVSGRPARPSRASGSVAVTAPSTASGASGSRQGTFRCTGPGRTSPRAAARARQATERKCSSPSSSAAWVPTSQNQRTEEPKSLIWSIVCPAPIPRSSGGRSALSTSSGSAGLVGLDHRRVVVGRRRARGAQQRHRLAARLRRAEREEAGGALVEDHAHLDLRLAPERQRERGRARAGGDHRPPQAATGELLDEGRGECGVGVGRVHAVRGDFLSHTDNKSPLRLEPVRLQRVLVDLDPEARCPRAGTASRRAARTRPTRSSRRRGAAVARPWANWSSLGAPGVVVRGVGGRAPAAMPTGPSRALET